MTCNCGCGGGLPCGCCEGVEILTPATIGNRPGLNAIGYRAGTHGTFLETMKARLAGSSFSSLASLKTRHGGDPAISLLDAWATVADVLTFYQERIANEGYLETALERRSVLELARLVGYELRPGVAASVYLAYTLDRPIAVPVLLEKPAVTVEPPDPLVTIPQGSRAQSVPGPGELPHPFETSADLVARSAWNNLQVRLTRPQRITAETRVIFLKGQPNLKPGDPLLIIASPPQLHRVITVTPDPPADRTKVTFKPWLESESGTKVTDTLSDSLPKIIKRFSSTERFGVVATSRSGTEVLELLGRLEEALNSGASSEKVRAVLELEVMPRLNELHETAVTGRFTRVEPWVRSLIEELERAMRGRTVTNGPTAKSPEPGNEVTNLTAILPALSRPRSLPPRGSSELSRSVDENLGGTTDVAAQLLSSLRPELKPILYKAWENVPVTPSPSFEVHAFQVRASVFGHNAPLEPVREGGVIVGTKEWDLQPPVPSSREQFELMIGNESGEAGVRITIDNQSTSFVALTDRVTTIDFPAANDKVEVTMDRQPEGRVIFEFRFGRRPLAVQIRILPGEPPSASLLRTDVPVSLEQPVQTASRDIIARGRITIAGAGASREEPRVLWLDAAYSQVLPGSWIALERPSSVIDTVTFLPNESTVVIARAVDVVERSRAEYGMTARSTRVQLEADWIDPTLGRDSFDTIRGTAVFGASQLLELAEEPIDASISGTELELDGLYEDLESGRWLIVAGERTDIVATTSPDETPDSDTEIEVKGVPGAELVMLAAVEQRFDPNLRGDRTHTYLRLANKLAYSYKRDSLVVYGNVVNATHGETRKETLGSGDASKSLQEFQLKQSPLTFVSASNPDGVETTLQVRVNDVLWHETDSLAALGPTDYSYITQTNDENKTSVIFGTGERGARLPTGPDNVTAVYRNEIGKAGNVKPEQISLLATRPLGVKGVINPMAASGGADRESRDQARRNAPLAVTALDRLVSTSDYADFARTFAGIAKASAARLSNGQRRLVHLTVAGSDDIPILKTSDLYRNLNKALREFGDPHQPIEVALRTFLLLVIEARVRILPDYLFEKVEPAIRAALLERFSFERRELGQDALLSDAMSTIHGVEGVSYVDVEKFDWIDEQKVVAHLGDHASLGEMIGLNERISVSLALVDTNEVQPDKRIKPAQIAYLNPEIPDTIILSEITV